MTVAARARGTGRQTERVGGEGKEEGGEKRHDGGGH